MVKKEEVLTIVQNDDSSRIETLALDPNSEIESGWTLLHSCAEFGAVKVLKALRHFQGFNLRVALQTKPYEGQRPIHIASSCGQWEFLEVLLSMDSDPDVLNSDEETALHLGVQTHEIRLEDEFRGSKSSTQALGVVKTLLSKGANINAQSDIGFSVLHYLGDPLQEDIDYQGVLQFLLERGANPNLQDKKGDTPLHVLACCSDWWSRKDAFRMLVEHGAELQLKNSLGETALDVYLKCAKQDGNFEDITRMLTPTS